MRPEYPSMGKVTIPEEQIKIPEFLKDDEERKDIKQFIKDLVDENGISIIHNPDLLKDRIKKSELDKRSQYILTLMVDEDVFERILNTVYKEPSDRKSNLLRITQNLWRKYGIEKELLSGIELAIQKGLVERILYARGKSVCNQLKEMRRAFAKANNIEYEEEDCTNTEPCDGTCQYCDSKIRELTRKAQMRDSGSKIVFPSYEVELVRENMKQNSSESEEDMIELGNLHAPSKLKRSSGKMTIEELVNKTPEDMMKVRNLGRKSLEEVMAKLEELGLSIKSDNNNADLQEPVEGQVSPEYSEDDDDLPFN